MTQNQEIIKLKNLYKEENGLTDLDIPLFVEWMRRKGYKMPSPPTSEQVLAKQVVKALKEETREDPDTGETYNVNVSFHTDASGNGVLWVDIDEAPRYKMVKVAKERRDQIVADAVQLEFLLEHWNKRNPTEQPITVEHDITFDVMLAKTARETVSEEAVA